jgi:hypothetical protein
VSELRDQPPGDPGREQRLTRGDDTHSLEQLRRAGVLHQEAAGAQPQRLEDVLIEVERGEHDDPHVREPVVLRDLARGGEAVHARHADVHQHDVGAQLPRQPHCRLAIGRLADHLDVVLGVE